LRVDPDRIKENLHLTGGLIYSQRVLSTLVGKGISRPDAYKLVQQNALAALKEKGDFRQKLKNDSNVKKYLKPTEIDELFDPNYFLRHQDYIYKRVFKKGKTS